ncbi:MAG: PDC sensor domain-containing protein, partial [Alphaproteobacteria bacterium]|nr:PDC sensor domain-containing protein [Alphaproteobacteria bacterium]
MQVQWLNSITVKFAAILMAVYLAMVALAVGLVQTAGRTILEERSAKTIEQAGMRIVTALGQQVAYVDALTEALADFGESVPYDRDLYRRAIPHILNKVSHRDIIAGGGLWPEPRGFDPARERASLFWGREPNGTLKYYDDYNDPNGPGYHHEEWYVPAKHVTGHHCFWSRSYMDPYSLEPMVTCTVPMHRDGAVLGVATVDMKLTGLHDMMARMGRELGGYVFALDRNNKFLSFPDPDRAKVLFRSADGKTIEEFVTARRMREQHPEFSPIEALLREQKAAI